MKCPQCGLENDSEKKFCIECGKRLTLRCPECESLLKGIEKFCGECGHDLSKPKDTLPIDYSQPQSYTPKYLADMILTTRSSIEGERKFVTVLFADVANYTSISENLDPEEVHQIMDGCFKILMDEIHKYEGTINQFTGDGVMALFGAPVAHEDHAQRGCHAALSIQKAIEGYGEKIKGQHGAEFRMRIGLNSGSVVVGSIGDDLRMDYTAVGDTTNLAHRMQDMANPGSVLVSGHTHRLSRDFFQFTSLGRVEVKGKEEPQEAYELIRPTEVETRIEAAVAKGLTRFVGRSKEIEALREAFEKAQSGSGQVIGVVGEAGVGKSRLLLELRVTLPEEEYSFLEGRCLHYGGSMPYLPILDVLKAYFDIEEEDREATKKKVREKLRELEDNAAIVPAALCEVLSLEVEDEQYLQLDPQKRRERTFEAIRDLLIRESQRKPLILAVEDLHWIDKTTEEFLDYLIGFLPTARILLILLYRPEYTHTWGSKSYYGKIGLGQLSVQTSAELIQAILEGGDVAPEIAGLVLGRAGGNPLFVEELTHNLIENGSIQKKNHQFVLTRKPSDIEVPDTIQGIIAARMDRIEENLKRIIQVASVIGREFAYRILQTITGMREDLKSSLLNLQGLEFIYEKQLFPELEYIFKHALTQEVAYNSLLLKRRKEIHEKIGQAIEDLYSERLEEYYELLAHHYGSSANTPKAVKYLHLAGKQAVKRSAYEEAIDQLSRAVELVRTLPETREHKELELPLQMILGQAFVATQGFPSVEADHAYVRARDLTEQLNDTSQLFDALNELRVIQLTRAEHDKSRCLAEELLRLARETGNPRQLQTAMVAMAVTLYWRGEFSQGLEHAEEGLRLYDPEKHRGHEYLQASANAGVWALFYLGWTLVSLGYPDQAIARAREALALAQELSHPFSEATALFSLGRVHLERGDSQASLKMADALIALSDEHGFRFYLGWGTLHRFQALTEERQLLDGIAKIRSVFKGLRAMGGVMQSSWVLAKLAWAHSRAGQVEEGLAVVAEAMEFVTKTGERHAEAELHRVKGELLLARTPADQAVAEESFRNALEIARTQSAKFWELCAATSLARLWQQQGLKDQGRELLAPIHEWFTEGFDTPAVKEAKALLDELT